MRPNLPLTLMLFLSAIGCTKQTEVPEVKKVKPDQIVLIFNKPVENGFFYDPENKQRRYGRTTEGDEIQIIDDNHIAQRLKFEIGAESDTIVIKSTRDQVEVRLMYKGVDDLSYLFQNGDSVLFNYDGIKPIASLLNRIENTEVTNFSLCIRDSISTDGFMANDLLRKPLLKISGMDNSGMGFQEYFDKMELEASTLLITEAEQLYDLLDQLKSQGKITREQYRFRLQNIIRNIQSSQVFLNKPGEEKLRESAVNVNKAVAAFESRYPDFDTGRNDSLLYSASYRDYLSSVVNTVYIRKLEILRQEGRGAGASTRNQLQRYDSIRASDFMSPLEKKIAQYHTMNAMLSEPKFFSIADRLKYLTRFKNDFNDTIMVQDLITRYNIEFQIDDEITLEDINGNSTSFSKAIASHRGKVIYVDFWASWCAPCIREMPESRTLQKELEGQDIVYLYISSDRKSAQWKKAMEKHELSRGLHYRITNANTSKGLEDMQIMFIPRYMIYDTTGRLVDEDAPRPSEASQLKAAFARYL